MTEHLTEPGTEPETQSRTQSGNLFEHSPAPAEGEIFEDLLRCRNLRIERILSSDRPDSELYDQAQDEWVCLLRGEASLWIAGETLRLRAGDYRFIPAHTQHRVLETSREPPCLWLAVHLGPCLSA
ncbi:MULTISPECIES: cupin domain-containing protein [Thiorhodovibrio]|uniref:cupin domain-containing protein n=1 Tax=Thiorhodovibrio TaxID=61593 RepID=UPI0019130962|nr:MULTISPECIES: cupin domain-containing protein [Thiorhodovibrio]MBK5968041.1 cupin [Thiorhodovibrio winogradskyi]WPL11857.1 nif11 domain/cupin domain protein [Thiorhodovibrio litoralis]